MRSWILENKKLFARGMKSAFFPVFVLAAGCLDPAQAAEGLCERGDMLAIDGTKGVVVTCSIDGKAPPGLGALAERLNLVTTKATGSPRRGADLRRDVERFITSLSNLNRALPPSVLSAFGRGLGERIQTALIATDDRLFRELDRLRVEFDDTQDKILESRDRDEAGTTIALEGAAGAALAALDFDQARRTLDGMSKAGGPCTIDPKLLARTRAELDRSWTTLANLQASTHCPSTWSEYSEARQSAIDAQGRGLLDAACKMYEALNDRVSMLVMELDAQRTSNQMFKDNFTSSLSNVKGLRDMMTSAHKIYSRQPANTLLVPLDKQRAFLQRGDQLLEESEALGRAGRYLDGLNRLNEALGNITAVNSGVVTSMGPIPDYKYPGSQCR